jgi:hypothetical protein
MPVWFDISSFGLNEWIAIGSAALALVSFLFNWRVVNRQTAMQAESFKAQMDAEVIEWAGQAIDALAEAVRIAKGRGTILSEEELRRAAADGAMRLSAIADKGRLFFPNLAPHTKGQDKEHAFRGSRPPILDALIFAHHKLERLDVRNLAPDEEAAAFFVKCRRLVVSEVQRAIDPRRRGKMLKRLAGAGHNSAGFKEAARLVAEFDAAHPGVIEEARDAAWVNAMTRAARRA